MNQSTFIIGGCRSGKSRFALNLANQSPQLTKLFMATCIPFDDEMKQRVKTHQSERDNTWTTLETPLKLAEHVDQVTESTAIILIDCLTLWISNLLMEHASDQPIFNAIDQLGRSIQHAKCPVIAVSNETGLGIVPDNKVARRFRDLNGFANQKIAQISDQVFLMTAGIPQCIKS